jgi:glycosyltransferase involved in cell wall biosynthesis
MYITPVFYPEVGGGEKYVLNLAREIAKKHEVIVITSAKILKGEKKIDNFLVYYLNFKEVFGTEVISIHLLYKLIRRIRPDIIHGNGPSITQDIAFVLSRIFDIPMIMTYQGNPNLDKTISRLYIKFATELVLKKICKIIVTSKMIYSEMIEKRGISQERLLLIPMGVEFAKFKLKVINKNIIRDKFALQGKKIILFVGGLGKRHIHKRPDLLINAIVSVKKEIPNTHLIIFGRGELVPEYKRITEFFKLQNDVSFHTSVNDDELPYYYSAADLFVLPSPIEPFGIVLLEAMSAGVPVIASDKCGGSFAIEEGKAGLVFKSNDIDDLSKKIIEILRDDSLASKFGENGNKYVQKYDWTQMAKEFETVYNEILSKSKR